MARWGHIFGQATGLCIVLLPAFILAFFSWPHLKSGLALQRVVPVPNRMIQQSALPERVYRGAAEVLATAADRDGESNIIRAEAAYLSGQQYIWPFLIRGLASQPASVVGWLLLAEADARAHKYSRASEAMSVALILSRREYYLSGRRVRDAAHLWPYLDSATRGRALDQARLLWEIPLLRPQLAMVLVDQPGAMIITRAFSSNPDAIRGLNRWLVLHSNIQPFSRGY